MADHDPGGPSRPPPKVKADFAQLLDDAGYQHAPDLTLEAIPPQPPSEKQLLVDKIARYNEQQDLLGLPRLVYSGRLGAPGLKLLCEQHGILEPVLREFEVCSFARGAAASGAQNCACTSTGTRSPRSRSHDFG